MPVVIRMARAGTKKRPVYHIVVADSRAPRDGRFIERLGTFDPLAPKDSEIRLVLDVEKAKEWLGKGAQPTDRVARLLDGVGALKREPRIVACAVLPPHPRCINENACLARRCTLPPSRIFRTMQSRNTTG